MNRFARDTLRRPCDPWQEWLNIHAGELLPDGRPRFRIVIVLVARQNGKTFELIVLGLYWQFIEQVELILGTSTKLDYARESWQKGTRLAEKTPDLDPYRPARWKRETNGEQVSSIPILDEDGRPTGDEARHKIAASNEEGGRSLTINRLMCDELRQHHDYGAWDACEPAASPMDAQIWGTSNAGDDRSVVLNDHREAAIEFIEWWDEHGGSGVAELLLAGQTPAGMPGDHRLGLFEWSAPEDADPTDVHALAQANPNMNRRLDGSALLAKARRAVARGGAALTGFKTENMCIHVRLLNPAIDPGGWRDCCEVGDLEAVRNRVACCLDVSRDELHATLSAAAPLPDGRVRGEVVRAWSGPACVADMLEDLPGLLADVKPRALGWFPAGPAASAAAKLKDRKQRGWPPRGVIVEEIRGEAQAVCMGFAQQVKARLFVHSDDPLLNAQTSGSEKLPRGDGWVFSRRGDGHCDATYSMAGAVHIARTLPPPAPKSAIF